VSLASTEQTAKVNVENVRTSLRATGVMVPAMMAVSHGGLIKNVTFI